MSLLGGTRVAENAERLTVVPYQQFAKVSHLNNVEVICKGKFMHSVI